MKQSSLPRLLILFLGVSWLSSPKAIAEDWEATDGYQPCLNEARKQISTIQGYINEWQTSLDKERLNFRQIRTRISSLEIQSDSCWQQILTIRKEITSSNESLPTLAKESAASDTILRRVREARKQVETSIPDLILNLRTTLAATDADLDQRIANLMERLENTSEEAEKQILKIRIDQAMALKTFRVKSGSSEKARELFEGYVTGKSEDAEQYASPQAKPLLKSARDAYSSYLRSIAAFDEAETEASRRANSDQIKYQTARAAISRLRDLMLDQKLRFGSLNDSLSFASKQEVSSKAEIERLQNGLNQNNRAKDAWQKDIDTDCFIRNRRRVLPEKPIRGG